MKLNTEISLLDQNNNNGMTLLGFKTILHKKCRFSRKFLALGARSMSSKMKTNFKKFGVPRLLPSLKLVAMI
jgi:hypothetical protein